MIMDIGMYESGSGGELFIEGGDLQSIKGLTNQVYLALFGGNVEQSTTEDLSSLEQRGDWWGNNLLETEFQFNSSFERTVSKVALTGQGLNDLVNAAKKDLEYLSDYAEISVDASIIGRNRVDLFVNLLEPDNTSTKIKFIWDNSRNEVIQEIII